MLIKQEEIRCSPRTSTRLREVRCAPRTVQLSRDSGNQDDPPVYLSRSPVHPVPP